MSEEYEEPELEDALAAALRVAGTVKNAESYDELAADISRRYADREDYERAVEIADTLNDPYTRDRTLAEIAVKCAAAGQEDAAFELLESLEDFSHQATGTSQIAIAHANAGEFDRAVEIADGMEDNAATLAEIASQCASKGEYERALEIVERLDFPLYAALALTRIAESYIKAGRVDEAVELLSQALNEASAIDAGDEKATTLSEIALKFADAGQAEQATVILSQAMAVAEKSEEIYKDTALSQIAASHSRLKQYDTAVKVTEKIDDVYQVTATLVSLAVIEHQEDGRQTEALQLLSDAYDLLREDVPETQREETQHNNLLALLAMRYADFGEAEQAIKAAGSIGAQDEKFQALTAVATRQAQSGKYNEALASARGIDEESHRASALLGISRAMIAADAKQQGVEVLSETVAASRKLARVSDRVHILTEAAVAYAEAGQQEQVAQLIQQALLDTKAVAGEYQKTSALLSISDACDNVSYELSAEDTEILWEI
jgi:tetratricopeptide (TPR) repeat protein